MISIATAQCRVCSDVRINGDEIRRLMRLAHAADVRIIHFSEGALSGYVKSEIQSWRHVDWTLLKDELDSVKQLARELELWVVIGCNHPRESDKRPYNSVYVISDEGVVHTRYDKRLCSNSEITDWYSPGVSPCVFTVDGFRFGCLLCIEIQFPALFMELEQLNVDCVLFSSYSEDPMFAIQAQGHAACNNYWLSFSVPANVSQHASSRFIGPSGSIVSTCAVGDSTLCINAIDPEDPGWKVPVKYARPWRRKARSGEIYEEFK